jgi:hypothetical protein
MLGKQSVVVAEGRHVSKAYSFSVTYEQPVLSCLRGMLCSQTPHRDSRSFEALMFSSPYVFQAA